MIPSRQAGLLPILAVSALLAACRPAVENKARPEFTFGKEAMLSSVLSIAMDAERLIYVLDNRAANVKVFDSEARFLRTLGVKGQGPGEIAAPASLEVDAGGRLIIYDLGNRKLVFFNPAGELLQEIKTAKLPRLFSVRHLRDDLFVGSVITYSETGRRVEEIAVIDREMNASASIARLEGAGSKDLIVYPPSLRYTILDGDRILWGNWLDNRLSISNSEGRVLETLVLDFKPDRISEEGRESIRKSRFADLEPGGRLVFPERFPCYARFQRLGKRVYFETFERETGQQGHIHYVWDEQTRKLEKMLLDPYPRLFLDGGYLAVVEDEDGNLEIMKVRLAGD